MKKLLIFAVVLLAVGSVSAQITYSIGYISTGEKALAKGATSNTETMNGLTIAVDDNINLTGNLNVAPGVGIDLSFRKLSGETVKKFGLYVPVDFNYGFDLGSDLKLSVYAGPTFDLGLIYNTKDYNFYKKEEGNMSRFDILLGGGAWLTYQDQYRLQIGYKAGLLNTSKVDNFTVKSNIFSISVGYIF